MRTALYARYSSDRQNERSIADQVAVLTDVAARRGWTVVASYMDAAISGQAMANRPGLLNALSAAERGEFDVLLVEDEDRVARDEEHQWNVYNRLGAAGVFLSTIAAERVSRMQVAFKSFMAAEYVQVLSQKTKRGLASNAAKGLATGSRLYGYRSRTGGAVTIVPDEAEVIRKIFRLHADDGLTPREIAARLNAEGIPSAKGGLWNASSIAGSAKRANGILHSEIYAGTKVYGRVERRKDRSTGKRATIVRPASEHVRVEVPDLAIIDRDLWDRAQARIVARRVTDPSRLTWSRRPQTLLSGLTRCGRCGGSYTALNRKRLVCTARRERGVEACTNRRHVSRALVERRVADGLRTQLLTPEAVAAYVRAYHAAWTAEQAARTDTRRPIERRLAEVERAITRGVDALFSGAAAAEAVGKKLAALEAEQKALQATLAKLDQDPEPPIQLHPRAAESYAARIAALQDTLAIYAESGEPLDRAAIDAVRALIERIDIEPESDEPAAPVRITLYGRLASFMGEPDMNRGWVSVGAPGRARTDTPLGTGF